MDIKIGEFSACTGLSKDTIRYYEKEGLLHPDITNNYRDYNEHHIEIAGTILKLKRSGFSLQEIKLLFEWSENTDQNSRLTETDIQNIYQLQGLFQNKYEQMIEREKEIKQIIQVLLSANSKIKLLIERNEG